jgi:predicted nucleotide-binding protein
MPDKTIEFDGVIFNADVLREAFDLLTKISPEPDKDTARFDHCLVKRGNEEWSHDSLTEFLSDYRKGVEHSMVGQRRGQFELSIQVYNNPHVTTARVKAKGPTRQDVESLFEVFERNANVCRVTKPVAGPPPLVVFIGHGRSQQWRDLKDHLQDQHGYKVEAYEIGARAGHAIRDILSSMLSRSSFAILVMTAEDKQESGLLHPRLNVVHELGLFQGKLGFSRAIVLLEENTEAFSNIQGLHQIRFAKSNIKETFGDVLATLRREFLGEP